MTTINRETRVQSLEAGLRDVLQIIFKYKARILGIFAAIVTLVTVGTFLTPPVYRAEASLLIKIGREYVSQPSAGAERDLMVVNQEEILNSEVQILDNRDLIAKVIQTMGVATLYPSIADDPPRGISPLEASITRFSKNLKAEAVRGSSVITVSFKHRDPAIATRALELVIDVFMEKHLQIFSNPEFSFLERQLEEYQELLKESERALDEYRQQHQLYSMEEQRSLLLRQQIELDTALKGAESRIQELQRKVESYRLQLLDLAADSSRYTQTERDQIVIDAQARLLNLQLQEQELLAKDYREDSRAVASVRKEIELVKGFLQTQEEDIGRRARTSNPVYQQLETEMLKAESELDAQRAASATIRGQLARLGDIMRTYAEKQNALRNLERQLAIHERNYLNYVEKREDARISEDLDRQKIASIGMIQPPNTPEKPVFPKKLLNIIIGIILGIISALGYAFYVEYMSQGLTTPEQVKRRLRLPVMASIALRQS